MSYQEVNLLPPELASSSHWFGARQMSISVGLFAFLLLTYTGLQALNLPALRAIEGDVQGQLNAMNAASITPSSNAELTASIDELQNAMAHQEHVLSALAGETQHTFSDYLRGLAESRVEGLWLEKIALERTPRQIDVGLHGRSLTTTQLPELLLALSENEIYRGYQFTDLQVQKDGPTIAFSFDTRSTEPAL